MALITPVANGRLTDRFDPDRGYVPGVGNMGAHTGQDIAAPAGTPIYAATDGVVSRKWWDAEGNRAMGGWMIEIRRDAAFATRYAHMQSDSPLPVGARVVGGQTVIGYVGSTGAANGPHLHLEVLINGVRVDPLPYLTGTASEGEDDMTPDQSQKLDAVYAAIFGPANVGTTTLKWASVDGARSAAYGVLDIDIHTQALIAKLIGQQAALLQAVQQLAGGGGTVDMAALEKAAEKGARDALSGLTLKAEVEG
jgi:hypothetical protein